MDGFGWEEGIKSALLAVGLDPEESGNASPGYNLLAEGAPNTFVVDGQESSWVRDDAVLAVAFVTDEEDCSMPTHLMQLRHQYEENGMPVGSICYQPEQRERFLDVSEMAGQLLVKKGEAQSRLTVSLIAGGVPMRRAGLERDGNVMPNRRRRCGVEHVPLFCWCIGSRLCRLVPIYARSH